MTMDYFLIFLFVMIICCFICCLICGGEEQQIMDNRDISISMTDYAGERVPRR